MKRLNLKGYSHTLALLLVFIVLLLGSKFIKSQSKMIFKSTSTIISKDKGPTQNNNTNKNNTEKVKTASIPQHIHKDGRYTGTAAGYKDNFILDVTVKDNKLTDIDVINYEEVIEYVKKAATPMKNKIIAAQSTDVDVVSGATSTSNGIKAAVNDALIKATYRDGTYKGSGIIYNMNKFVNVNVIIKEGKINKVDLISQDEIPEFNKAWLNITSAVIKNQSTIVDVVTGATYASDGIINAVYNGISKAEILGAVSNYPSKDQIVQPFKDGKYKGIGKGNSGNLIVEVTIKSNKIEKLDLGTNGEDPEYLKRAWNAISDEIVKKQSAEVDAVSGATRSSNGLIMAVKDALRNAKDW